ncbi:MAG: DUF4349 domain-containing protein [Actinomycetota bacterium]|nr:DUF4349 domain-containing protein [Actinomycetota bacterium]
MTRKRWMGVASAVLLTVFVAAMVFGCGGEEERDAGLLGEGLPGDASQVEELDLKEAVPDEAGYAQSERAAGEAHLSPASSPLPQLQLKVIKSAVVELETGEGGYAKIRKDAVVITTAAGGYVEGESSSRDDEGFTYATLTLRIPADKFDGAVEEVSALGEMVSTQVSTSDVSAEYVDLESRLRHLQAEEAFYLGLIGKARDVQEMIAIREHLSAIQQEKEMVQGRMNFLDQQVGYSTLTLAVEETAPEEDGEGFWDSVGDAFRSFGRGMKKLAIGLFYALPYLVILVLIVVVVWLLLRRSRKKPPTDL